MPDVVTILDLTALVPSTVTITRDPTTKLVTTMVATFAFATYTVTYTRNVDNTIASIAFMVT